MANQLKIKSYYKNTAWVIESYVADTSDSDFPREVFLWTVAKNGSLDKFQAIGHADQVAKYPKYDSNRTSNFGIHLVRHSSSTQTVQTEAEKDDVITVLKSAFQYLLNSFEIESTPVEEVYP